jgi:hypothetical protein
MMKPPARERLKVIERDLPMATEAREAGKRAFLGTRTVNPPIVGSLGDYCWQAGYRQDVRSVEQLIIDWRKEAGW